MRTRSVQGKLGEQRAAQFLVQRGYRILACNYRVRQGEIDCIACNQRFVVFAEVKTRADARFAQAREFVTVAKQRRLLQAAAFWLQQNPLELQPRFDVIEVYWPQNAAEPVQIQHIENAFEA